MLNKFKRFICLVMVIVIFISVASPISASSPSTIDHTDESILSKDFLSSQSLDQLYTLSREVENEINVNSVFEEILNRLSAQENSSTERSSVYSSPTTSAAIDNYISFVSATVTTSHVLTIVVNVKANIPTSSYFNFTVGYEYPSSYRTEGSYVNMSGRQKGLHTITINTKGFVGRITVYADIVARNYTEHKHFKTLFDRPYTSNVVFHTITEEDVRNAGISNIIVAGVLTFIPGGKLTGIYAVLYKVTSYLSFTATLDIMTPSLAVGQYYKTTTTYTDNAECKINIQVYSSEDSYNAGRAPIHTSNATIFLP